MFAEQNLIDIRDKITSLSARPSWLKGIKHLFQHAVPSLIEELGGKDRTGDVAEVKGPSFMA